MPRKDGVGGKIGDVSGKMGDVSGVEGKMGDVSGDSTLAEIKDFLLQDRGSDTMGCLEAKIRRLENEILGIARWLDLRLRILEANNSDFSDRLDVIEGESLADIAEHLIRVDERLDALEGRRGKPSSDQKT